MALRLARQPPAAPPNQVYTGGMLNMATEPGPSRTAVPVQIMDRWQDTVDLLAEITGVASGVITRLHPTLLEVLLASESPRNPYKRGGTAPLRSGLCCETVILRRELLSIPNALKDPDWAENPNIALGL